MAQSACTYCPFALSTPSGRDLVLALYLDEPDAAVRALALEHSALDFNPRQGLADRATLAALLAATGRHDDLLGKFTSYLAVLPWQVYEIRRVIRPSSTDSRPGLAARSLRILAAGGQATAHSRLEVLAHRAQVPLVIGNDGIARAWLRHRSGCYPDAEHFLVAAPKGAIEKDGPGFAAAWHSATRCEVGSYC